MTLDSGREPTEWESVPRPTTQPTPAAQPLQYNSARHGSHVEESPELLRWRADLLMDEMMMGGVDVSAADGNRTFSGVDAPVVHRPQAPASGGSHVSDNGRSPRDSYEPRGYENGSYESASYKDASYKDASYREARNERASYDRPFYDNGPTNGGDSEKGYRNGSPNSSTPSTNGQSNGGYPSPSSSDHFTPEPPRNVDPRYAEPRAFDAPPSDNRQSGRPDVGNNYPYSEAQRQPPTRPTPPTTPSSDAGYDNRGNENRRDENYDRGAPRYGVEQGRVDESRLNRPLADEPPSVDTTLPSSLKTTMDGAPATGEQTPRTDRLYSVEQQYEQFRREQSANVQPVEPTRPPQATRPPLPPIEPSRQVAPPRVTPQPADDHTQWATGPDKWEYQDFSANPQQEEAEESLFAPYPGPERRTPQDSGVRHDPAQFVSAMSVMGGSKKRSTLLPRSTELDIDTLHREISDLHGEIAALLPVGNDTSERARHLLDKAYSILQSDPSRSAEVEYYMQQVRSIVQRLHQSRQWSDLYRQRLRVYLTGWLGLSAVVVLARFVFQTDMEQAMMWLFGLSWDSLLVAHWATFIGTAFAGALGGAIGALYTMQTHARGEYSFFDRKYGLRGLILPFMGLIVGALGYVIFGLIFALVGIDPSQNMTVAIVPTMAAFAFGFSQESIYGTRS